MRHYFRSYSTIILVVLLIISSLLSLHLYRKDVTRQPVTSKILTETQTDPPSTTKITEKVISATGKRSECEQKTTEVFIS